MYDYFFFKFYKSLIKMFGQNKDVLTLTMMDSCNRRKCVHLFVNISKNWPPVGKLVVHLNGLIEESLVEIIPWHPTTFPTKPSVYLIHLTFNEVYHMHDVLFGPDGDGRFLDTLFRTIPSDSKFSFHKSHI